ncbi:MAG TPA: hypothetical protein VJN50_04655 [Actinomycetota bacterium]|nr:hypothetical protein [Actinomycetota bacterium]
MSPIPADLGDGGVLRRHTRDDLGAIWTAVEAERTRMRDLWGISGELGYWIVSEHEGKGW